MARGTIGLGLTGLFVVFLVVLVVLPYISRMFPSISGFAAKGETEDEMEAEEGFQEQEEEEEGFEDQEEEEGFEDMTCTPGLKPCPEGYFCEQNTCVPILPRYDINSVVGVEDQL